ncbi:MAG: N-6 DNA methylase [Promethearchaeota archaeon]|jgi:hypothetical protein
MEQEENLNQFKNFIEVIYAHIDNKDIKKLETLLPLIESYENIFLKLYHKRKKEGVYYTSEQISSFISNEVLILLINNKLNIDGHNLAKIQNLNEIFKLDAEMRRKIGNSLYYVTICDPACGSGGFLLSAVDIIFKLVIKLNPKRNKFEIKKQLLKNLYGYDINSDAINLSVLKLFRWIFDDNSENIPQIVSQLKTNFKSLNTLTQTNLNKFDIIIGNPPYGNILDRNEKEFLKLNWASEIIGFLVPKSFLLRQGYIEFRRQFLRKANILKIIDMGSKQFKNATNEVQVLLFEKKGKTNSIDLAIYDYPDIKINSYRSQFVDSLKVCFNFNCPLCIKSKKLYVYTYRGKCPFCGSKTVKLNRIRIKPNPQILQIINKIEISGDLNYLNPVMFPKMIRGEEDKGLFLVKDRLTNNTENSCYFISARTDFKYYYIQKNRSFNIEEIDAKSLKGNNFEYYLSPKLLIKHNNIIPEAVYSEENICFTSSIYSLIHENPVELKYICAVLNSALIQFYCIYAINNQKNTTINLNQYMIRHLPIALADNQTKARLVKNVDEIINLYKNNEGLLTGRIKSLLTTIDESILNLYPLTENEKEIIIFDLKSKIKHYENIYH